MEDRDGHRVLDWAAFGGDERTLKYLLSKHRSLIDISHVDNKGRTALHWAAQRGASDAVRTLPLSA